MQPSLIPLEPQQCSRQVHDVVRGSPLEILGHSASFVHVSPFSFFIDLSSTHILAEVAPLLIVVILTPHSSLPQRTHSRCCRYSPLGHSGTHPVDRSAPGTDVFPSSHTLQMGDLLASSSRYSPAKHVFFLQSDSESEPLG